MGSWYLNRPARTHGFNAKIGFEKYAPRPNILSKKCRKSAFQTKPAKLDTFWLISRDSVHISKNRESEPVNLNTINPIIRTIFFTYKGVGSQFKLKIARRTRRGEVMQVFQVI